MYDSSRTKICMIVSENWQKYLTSVGLFRTGTQNSRIRKGQLLCSQHVEVKLLSFPYLTTFNKEFAESGSVKADAIPFEQVLTMSKLASAFGHLLRFCKILFLKKRLKTECLKVLGSQKLIFTGTSSAFLS